MRRLIADAGLEDVVEVDSAGHRRLARRRAAGRARDGGGAAPRRDARGRRPPGPPGGLRSVRPDRSRWTARTCATCARWHPTTGRARSSGCCATSTRADGDHDVPDPYYGGDRGFETVLDMVERRLPRAARRAARRRSGVSLEAAVARAVGRAVRGLKRVGGGDINDAYTAELEGGGRAFVKTRARAPAGEYASEAAGLDWLAEPRALGVPEVLGVLDGPDEPRLLALEWLDAGPPGDAGASSAAGWRPCTRPERLRSAARRCCGSGRSRSRTTRCRTGPRSTPSAGCGRCSRPRATAARSLPGRAGGRAASATGSMRSPGRPSRRRACTATCGAATCCGAAARPFLIDPVAYGGHREVDLAMLRLFGAPGAAPARRLRGGLAARRRPRGPRRAVAAVPAARPRGAVRRRATATRSSGPRGATRVRVRRMDLGISGRVAVVTGASRGIGAATAELLEGEGARVVRVSRGDGIDVTAPDAAERIAERARRRRSTSSSTTRARASPAGSTSSPTRTGTGSGSCT